MLLYVKHKRTNLSGLIVGWCPDGKGRPRAMVLVRDRIYAFKVGEFRVIEAPSMRQVQLVLPQDASSKLLDMWRETSGSA